MSCHRQPLCISALLATMTAFLPWISFAQAGTGLVWGDFGPLYANGSFTEITRQHYFGFPAHAVAADTRGRVLTLTEWRDSLFDLNLDCTVTRHTLGARLLDMDFTGELEASRRIALDLGGLENDHCVALDADPSSFPVVAGYSSTAGEDTAFVVRLTENGSYDPVFSFDGKFTLENLGGFAGFATRFEDVETYPDRRVLACGSVLRGTERNMLVMRFTVAGALDTTFNGTGYREIDFNGGGADTDLCRRLLILPDQRIVLAGTANGANGDTGYALVRLNANGTPDGTFSGDGRVVLDDSSQLNTPSVEDVGYDATRQRLIVAATSTGVGPSIGSVVAVNDGGALDPSFDGDGRRSVRFSAIAYFDDVREFGATELKRVLVRRDGRIYVAGTHVNSAADAAAYGETDVAVARLLANGANDYSPVSGFSVDGVAFYAYAGMGHQNVKPQSERLRVGDELKDAIFYRGNLLLLSDSNRYPEGTWDDVAYGLGPIAPVLAGIVADRIWDEDWELDGVPEPGSGYALISVPAGYGRYCSVRDPISFGYGLLAQGAASDPCQEFLNGDPDLIVERAGLYSLAGPNNVLTTCAGGFIGLHPGNGGAPFDAALAFAAGQSDCIFTAAPVALPVFSRPYSGAHVAGSTQSFNHDAFNIPIDVSDFGQTPISGHPLAHYIDLAGVQKCFMNGSNVHTVIGGVDEAAADIVVGNDKIVLSVAAGRVAWAVPRNVLAYSPVGNDPYQRELFVRHSIGSGRYQEEFTSYYAHMSDTRVRRGDAVVAGTQLGRVGTTGASSGEHLHIAVLRHHNLSFRPSFDLDYTLFDFWEGKEVAMIDPWGWLGPQALDPWAWRFRQTANNPANAGSWSINLWKAGEAPLF